MDHLQKGPRDGMVHAASLWPDDNSSFKVMWLQCGVGMWQTKSAFDNIMSGLSQSDLVTDDLLDVGEGEIAGTCCVSDASACDVPASSSSSNNDDDSSCFSGESPVSLADGSSKAMADVVVGDQVKVVTADGQVSFSFEVVFVPHAANSVKVQFVHMVVDSFYFSFVYFPLCDL